MRSSKLFLKLIISIISLSFVSCEQDNTESINTAYYHNILFNNQTIAQVEINTSSIQVGSSSTILYSLTNSFKNMWMDSIITLVISYKIFSSDTIEHYYTINGLSKSSFSDSILLEITTNEPLSEQNLLVEPILIETSSGPLHNSFSNIYYGSVSIFKKDGSLSNASSAKGLITADGKMKFQINSIDSIQQTAGYILSSSEIIGTTYFKNGSQFINNIADSIVLTSDSLFLQFQRLDTLGLDADERAKIQFRLKKLF